jgi:F-type H+-transporting ATPase subunit b
MAAETGMPQLDTSAWPPQLFWLGVTFLALYFIVSRKVIPGVGGTIAARKARISDDLAAAQKFKLEVDEAAKAYEAALAAAKAKAHVITQEAQARLDAEADAHSRKLDAELAAKIGAAEKSIAAARKKALGEVKTVAAEMASQIVSQLTGSRVTKTAVEAAVAKAGKH